MQNVVLSTRNIDDLINDVANKVVEKIGLWNAQPLQSETDELLTVPQAAEFLRLTVPTIYGLLHKGSIPSMKQGKRVYFSKQELLAWLKDGRKNTLIELGKEADVYLETLKIKRG
jgi:excisionase family DNA binding protein